LHSGTIHCVDFNRRRGNVYQDSIVEEGGRRGNRMSRYSAGALSAGSPSLSGELAVSRVNRRYALWL
jgi:hypothetical protein